MIFCKIFFTYLNYKRYNVLQSFYLIDLLYSAIIKLTKYSFPSEHATIFAALGIAGYFVNHIFGIILLFIAILIGIGRAGVGVHYKRDIVAGWALGVIIALVFIHFIHLI